MATESESARRKQRLKLILENCPCNHCERYEACAASGIECARFREWVRGRKTPDAKRGKND